MENEKQQESIFEQENFEGGLGSGPATTAPEPEQDEADGNADHELDIDP